MNRPLLSAVLPIVFAMLSLALLLAFTRLLRGPSLPDRVVALDLIALLVVGLVATHDVAAGRAVFLDAALVVALVAFLGTAAFAHYVGKSGGAAR